VSRRLDAHHAAASLPTGVTVSDVLPAGTVFVSASTSQGTVIVPVVGSNGTVTVDLGSLAKSGCPFRELARRRPGLEIRVDYRGEEPEYEVVLSHERYRPSVAMRRRIMQYEQIVEEIAGYARAR